MEIREKRKKKFTWKWTIDGKHFLCEILKVQNKIPGKFNAATGVKFFLYIGEYEDRRQKP